MCSSYTKIFLNKIRIKALKSGYCAMSLGNGREDEDISHALLHVCSVLRSKAKK